MKLKLGIICLVAATLLFSGGCGKGHGRVKMSDLEQSFNNAEPALKETASQAVTAIKASDYGAAFRKLGELNRNATLTAEQKQAVMTALHEVSPLVPPPQASGGPAGQMPR